MVSDTLPSRVGPGFSRDSSSYIEDIEDEGEGFEEDLEGEGDVGDIGDSGVEDTTATSTKTDSVVKKKRRRKKKVIGINLSSCKYESVRRMSKKFGMKEVGEDEDWTLYWTDWTVPLERVMEMKKYQKVNHFPGMTEICRKDLLGRNMTRLLKLFPKDYAIFPRTWVLPADYGDYQAFCRTKKNKTYICKPESGCQGKGIFITKNPKDIKPGEHMVCQQYLSKPFLIDNYKFDFRIYVLVTSCDPFRIYVYKDGLVRFATVKYTDPTSSNVDDVCMHLTNYAINKHSSDFIRDDESGHKRKITIVDQWFKNNGYDIDKIWRDIHDVIIKTLITAHPVLKHNYRTCFPNHIKGSGCFEILGFDVMLDKKLKPWLIEVNHSPSFHTDAKLDKEVKEGLLYDTMNIINLTHYDKKKCLEEDRKKIKERLLQRSKPKEFRKEEYEDSYDKAAEAQLKYEEGHLGDFTRIYPVEDSDKYEKYFQHSGSLFQETAASKARGECARLQREEIRVKQEKLEMMLKKKPSERKDSGGVRPESPNGDGRTRRRARPTVPRVALGKKHYYRSRSDAYYDYEVIDTTKPLDIVEEEELERISALLQRDNLVRGLGVVEHVYRLLHCTPGTVGVMKNADRQPNEYHRLALTSSVPYSNSVLERRMNTYLHLDTPPYHKRSNHPSYHKKRSSSKSSNTEATRPSLLHENKTPASNIPEVFAYNMHNHLYYTTEMHVSKLETVSDPTLSGQSTSRSKPLPSQDPPSLAPGSDLSRRVTEGGRLKDNSKESAGKDKQRNNNSSHQSLPEMHSVYRTDRTSQRPNSTCWPRLSDGRARVVWDEHKKPSNAMNGVLTVEALKQWVPDTKQRGSTSEIMTTELGLQFLSSCQKTLAARHVKELDDQQHSMSSGSVKKKPSAIPLLSLNNLVTKKNQNNNSNGSMEDYPHLPDTSSKTSLSPLKYVSGTELLLESLDDIASAGNSSVRMMHMSEDFKRKTDMGEEVHGAHRSLNDIASARNLTERIPHQGEESMSKTDLREEEHGAKRSHSQRWGRKLLVAPKQQKFDSPWNDKEEVEIKCSCSELTVQS
ncbi:tubulin polyglutamylase ttll6 isoform X1 [Strongylocentrotus purpuratus]|uniref:Uncharacterized protein n=1 Tax=Strongylocentrotus purpuratus TaxID=7668 RepID=A0A7M7HHM3_STRPU|nr:tubulin polyglutamylase ttll6 isoform X1 [Strongylocentrotus purpuratus]|eukprot:XP_011677514.1 PREDICTED: tubulin polyglutamylase ttll6 isoform X1 [Strongylocentrotus purpuratus]